MDRRLVAHTLALAVWTAAIGGALWLGDRWLGGADDRAPWTELTALRDAPSAARALGAPSYLPDSLAWPPARIFVRTDGAPGWWLGLGDRATGAVRLWIGSGAERPAIAPLADCSERGGALACQPPWRPSTQSMTSGARLHGVSSLPVAETARILAGFR